MSDSPLPWAWPAPELGEPAWPGPPPAYDPAPGAAYAPAAADPDAANALPAPRRGLLKTSDAADVYESVYIGGGRINK
ncbi:hypothetical protein ACFWCD_16880, partial [Streptomyces goshikiensis]